VNTKRINHEILNTTHLLKASKNAKKGWEDKIAVKESALADLKVTSQALAELQSISERIQLNVYQSVQNLATYCLQAVFGSQYSCQIDTVIKRGKVELDIFVMKGRLRLDPMTACGGGIADVLALALRIGVILADNQTQPRQILICDEPCRFVSEAYRPAVAELLESLSETYGFQLIMVTHDEAFKIGKVIEVG